MSVPPPLPPATPLFAQADNSCPLPPTLFCFSRIDSSLVRWGSGNTFSHLLFLFRFFRIALAFPFWDSLLPFAPACPSVAWLGCFFPGPGPLFLERVPPCHPGRDLLGRPGPPCRHGVKRALLRPLPAFRAPPLLDLFCERSDRSLFRSLFLFLTPTPPCVSRGPPPAHPPRRPNLVPSREFLTNVSNRFLWRNKVSPFRPRDRPLLCSNPSPLSYGTSAFPLYWTSPFGLHSPFFSQTPSRLLFPGPFRPAPRGFTSFPSGGRAGVFSCTRFS